MVALVVVVTVEVLPPARVSVPVPPKIHAEPLAPLSLKFRSPIVRFAVRSTVVAAVIFEVKLAANPAPSATIPLSHGAVVISSQLPPVVEIQVPVAACREGMDASVNDTLKRAAKRLKREFFISREEVKFVKGESRNQECGRHQESVGQFGFSSQSARDKVRGPDSDVLHRSTVSKPLGRKIPHMHA